jgi:hypothetical protein
VKKLYVGNVSYQANEEELNRWFAEAGFTVDSVSLIRDRYSGEPRGFGFVEIANDDEADRAIQTLNGKDFLGRNLVVNEARPMREGGGRGGRGGGGGGGRGGWGGGGGRGGGGGGRGGRGGGGYRGGGY